MRKNPFLITLMCMVLAVAGCDGGGGVTDSQRKWADSLMNAAYISRDYQRIMTLADSLKATGLFSEGKTCYWLGYASDRMNQKRMAEFYWKMGITATEEATDDESVNIYANTASRLTGLKCTWGEYEAALKVSLPAVDRLRKLGCDTTSEYTNLLIYTGCCQSHFGISESAIDETLQRGYDSHLKNISMHPNAIACRDAMVGVINIIFNYIEMQDYKKAMTWINNYGDLIGKYAQMPDARSDYLERQQGRYELFRATALEGTGRRTEAAAAYQKYRRMAGSQTAEGRIFGCDYLRVAGRWQEAADNYSSLDELMAENKSTFSLENIQKMLLKKFEVNMMAGRLDSAKAVSMAIAQHLDSAITATQVADAREHEAVHQKEQEMVAERQQAQHQRMVSRLTIMAVIIAALFIYIIVRQRAAKRLAEVKAAQERIESELRIARNIQMSMLPSTFPQREGLEMFASMTPAKEVGGDLYGYLMEGNRLYFALGDVSGKGVPASLFMAQATRLFLTLAKQGMMPAEICTRMNDALSGEDNENSMFVTFFLGLVDLETGHLDFCNAGHNPPVIGGGSHHVDFLEMLPNVPIGLFPGFEYAGEQIDTIKDRPLFIYTDGLNEAENPQQEQFGDDRLLSILRTISFDSAQQVIETLQAEVETHRNGAEPNDDLTMMCLNVYSGATGC